MKQWREIRSRFSPTFKRAVAILSVLLAIVIIVTQGAWREAPEVIENQPVEQNHESLTLSQQPFLFLENKGQWHDRARFMARQNGMTAWFEDDAITLRLSKQTKGKIAGVVTRLAFVGASGPLEAQGQEPLKSRHSYFMGNDTRKWRGHVAGYKSILYRELYEGIDLRVRDNHGMLEYDLLLQPHADLDQVAIECDGIESLSLDSDGSLVIETAIGPIRQKPPTTWHEVPTGEQVAVLCEYRLLSESHFGFAVEDRQPELALVVDPGLEWGTFVGGPGLEIPGLSGLALAENGDVLLGGATGSMDFPTTMGAYDTSNAGELDVFVSRWDSNERGTAQLIWSTLMGGAGSDGADFSTSVEVDASGNIIVTGNTASPDFPITPDAYDTTYNGNVDGFVLKLNSSGSSLLYATFLGGSGADLFIESGLDDADRVSVIARTFSTDFPVTADAFDTSANGGQDLALARLDLTQNSDAQLVWSTFFGGSGDEDGLFSNGPCLAVRPNGNIIFGGGTRSRDFPTTPGAFREHYIGGTDDGFVAELDPKKSGYEQLIFSTYFGGVGEDIVTQVVVADQGQVMLGGSTGSADLPTTPDAYLRNNLPGDATLTWAPYITWLDPRAQGDAQLLYSTYIAKHGSFLLGLAADSTGAAIAVGFSIELQTTSDAHQPRNAGDFDAFALRLDRHQTGAEQLTYSTYLGGAQRDDALDVVIDTEGNWIISGDTGSAGFPVTSGAFDRSYAGGVDAFLAKLNPPAKIPDAKRLAASLTGQQVVPPVETVGQGFGKFILNSDSTELKYDLTWDALSGDVKSIRIYLAPADANGPIVATLVEGTLPSRTVSLAGVWRANDEEPFTPELVTALCEARLNITMTSTAFPSGEIRGQIVPDPLAHLALAQPGVFYAGIGGNSGAAGENRGEALSIDPASGAGTLLGGPGLDQPIWALAIDTHGRIFVQASGPLYRLDAESGSASLLSSIIGNLVFSEAMAFDLNNNLYCAGPTQLFRVDTETGIATYVANWGLLVVGMAFDPIDNILWVSTGGLTRPDDTIYTVDLVTGRTTLVGETGFGGATPGIAFDENGNLFGVKGGGQRPNDLIAIDKETGAGTLIGPIGFNAVSSLAMKTPPKPGPQLGLNARTINFRPTRVGDSVTRDVVISNFGTESLTITAIADPGEPFAFSSLPSLPLVLAPGQSERFEARFSPTVHSVANARITLTSNDAEEPVLERALEGKGVALDDMALAVPGTVYASTGLDDGARFLTINPETGEGTLLGPTGLIRAPALAINSKGEIYATDGGDFHRVSLYRVDARDGTAVFIAPLGSPIFLAIDAIAFDTTDVLYAFEELATLLRLDTTTGASTEIARFEDIVVAGMAFDPTNNKLWASTGAGNFLNSDMIWTVDVVTGDTVHIGRTGLGGSTPDLFFDDLGNLYGVKGGGSRGTNQPEPSNLIRIDKSTGVGTVIGSIGFTSVSGLAAFRYTPVVDNIADSPANLPAEFALLQNYPNPFNPTTLIRYDLPKAVAVELVIYDILGRKVRTLVDGKEAAGAKQITWDGRNDSGVRVATGLYVYRIKAGDFIKARKLMLIR